MNITKDYLDENPILYKYVFVPHKNFGWLYDCQDTALENDYPFFLWNDVVYHSATEHSTPCTFGNESGKLLLSLLC